MMVLKLAPTPLPVTERAVLNEANACTTDRPLDTRPLSEERAFAFWQKDIPEVYWDLDGAALAERIADARRRLGTRCVVLGHHYQREDIIQFADYRGDSFNLARWAAERGDAEFIVFCGVHFMAESADILTDERVHVILPDLGAGCSMADMANLDQVEETVDAGAILKQSVFALAPFVGVIAGNVEGHCKGGAEMAGKAPRVVHLRPKHPSGVFRRFALPRRALCFRGEPGLQPVWMQHQQRTALDPRRENRRPDQRGPLGAGIAERWLGCEQVAWR